MQPTQNLYAIFLRRLAERRECAPSRIDCAPCIVFVGQRDGTNDLTVGGPDDVHYLAAVGRNERAVNVVCCECYDLFVHTASPCVEISGQNEVTTTRLSDPSLSAA